VGDAEQLTIVQPEDVDQEPLDEHVIDEAVPV